MVEATVRNPDFPDIIHYMMQGFGESQESSNKRFYVVRTLMKSLEGTELPGLRSNTIVCRVIEELPKFETKQLVDLTDLCVEFIQKGNVTEMW